MTLSEVIDEAVNRYRALVIADDPEVRGVRKHEYIAAAVAAHLTSDQALACAVQAACRAEGGADVCQFPECGCTGRPITISAAIRAAIGGEHG